MFIAQTVDRMHVEHIMETFIQTFQKTNIKYRLKRIGPGYNMLGTH